MSASKNTQAGARAKTRLVNLHKADFDRFYQEELNKLGLKTRKQQLEERYGKEENA